MEHKRLTWLKQIYPDFKENSCFEENVYKPTDLKYYSFFQENKRYRGFINPKNIVGIDYGFNYNCFYEINWYELFCSLKKLDRVMENFKTKEDIENHIHNDKDPKMVYKFGNYYFTTSGQHRLCLAKFLGIEKVEVSVVEYKLDKERLVRYKKIKEVNHKISEYRLGSLSDDKNLLQWSRNCEYIIKISNEWITIDIDLILDFIAYYENYKIFRILCNIQIFVNKFIHINRVGERIKLKNKDDFKKVNSLIIKHKMKYIKP